MNELNYPTPDCPAQLLKLNEIHRELESPQAFAELVADCQEDFDPTPTQGLNAAILIVSQLQKFHFDVMNDPELDPWQAHLWEADFKHLTDAINALRQVTQD